ncbi:TonB-dependent siderophore receptor [Edaphobacter modestus]|uniref:Catecholate siderophore receptor n=1 Tax=Edaphobacter modestus TaxID=388466 RepID=A0A4Q7YV17_9BACT|nr:TonB-dependent siderophore receptor [Edaphobacter modestus]RZU41174.1 catecholate siderophore receptor [Edaphobacter modestus]
MKNDARRRNLRRFAGSKSWLAVGTLAAYTVMGTSHSAQAAVKSSESGAAAAVPPASNAPVKRLNIAAGSLEDGIKAYEQQTGMHIRVDLPQGTLAGFQTKGVSGAFTDEEGLRLLLAGTGLSAHVEDESNAVVGLRASESVDVSTSPNSIGLAQFTETLTNTPQTVNVVPQFIMQEQAATTIRDGLRNVPGVSIAAGEGGAQGDNLTIRGFSARNDMFIDGIRDFGSYYRDAFNYEAIEVLQGPASVEFGRGSTGGVVNQESKMPVDHEIIRGTLQLGTNQMRRLTADVNEPLTDFIPGAAFRMNVVGTQSKVAERDYAETRRFGIAPGISFGLNRPTHGGIFYLHESEDSIPDYGIPYLGVSGARVDRSTFYGYATDSHLNTNPDIVTGRIEHDFSNGLVLRSTLRWGNYPRDVRVVEPQINTNPTLSVINGVATATCSPTAATPCYNVNTPLANVLARRNVITRNSTEDILWEQTQMIGRLKIKSIENNFVVTAEGGRERSRPQSISYPATIFTPVINPNAQDPLPAPTVGARTYVTSNAYGVSGMDTLKLTQWLQLSGGVRFDYFYTFVDPTATSPQLSQLIQQPTYRAAVVVKPARNGSIYFDYGTSFNPSAESLSLSANNAVQDPQENETYEAGTKWDLLNDRLNVSGAYFRTNKTNVYETNPQDTTQVLNVGSQRVQGFQIGALGHMASHFDVILGYAYLNGVVTQSVLNASPFGSLYKPNDPIYGIFPYFISPNNFPLANVPRNSGNLWVTHNLPWRFVGGFGGNFLGPRRASSTALVAVPLSNLAPVSQTPMAFKSINGYWIFNMMLRRPINDRLDFQANLINLTNKFYIDQPHPNHLIPGEGFNAQFGFNMHF